MEKIGALLKSLCWLYSNCKFQGLYDLLDMSGIVFVNNLLCFLFILCYSHS